MSPKTIEERLASMETTLGHIHDTWKTHVADENDYHERLDVKVEKLLLAGAREEGERSANRRLAGIISFVVSTCVGLLTAACVYLNGG